MEYLQEKVSNLTQELKETRHTLEIEKQTSRKLRKEHYSLTNTVATLQSLNTSLTESLSRTTEKKNRYRRRSEASEKANQVLLVSLEDCKRTKERLQAKIRENEKIAKEKTKVLKLNSRKEGRTFGQDCYPENRDENKENDGKSSDGQLHSQLLATNKRQKRDLKQLSDVQERIIAQRRALRVENNELRDTIAMLDGHATEMSVTRSSTTVRHPSSSRLANALERALQEVENDRNAKPVAVRQYYRKLPVRR